MLILIWKVDRNVGLFWYIFVPVPYRLMWHTVSNIILGKCLGLRVEHSLMELVPISAGLSRIDRIVSLIYLWPQE